MDNTDIPIDSPPAERIALAATRFGEAEVASRAASLLSGANEGEEFLLWVGGRHAQGILDGAPPLYWPEVWGARALLGAWDESAASVVLKGLKDRAWRVREMCARVVLARGLGTAAELTPLLRDDNPRVRAAGAAALAAIGEVEAIRPLLRDPEKEVRARAREELARASESTRD